ncbi:glycosyltransferase [Lentzea sp. HUAS12]|uniref:glycosyltransferase n=1 Tax=Lentzea sp. HUAS12 TaxID=2951806 RepID=UPI0020A0FBDB|nr:glycosyltransferase [Lentzea sp. HUAS12]USX53545.1 glycosyltransferase [Lentzea sp. HUAS12]
MRIAMVSAQASPLAECTAQGAHVTELCAGLSASGHDVVAYTRRDDSTSPDVVRADEGHDVVHVPAGPARVITEDEFTAHLGDFAAFLAERWRVLPPDVVHSHHWTSGLASLIGAHHRQIPVVHSYHGLGESPERQRSDAETLLARRAAWITATSAEEAAHLWQHGVRRARVSVVPSGVDASLFTPEGPAEIRDGRMRVVTANLDPCNRTAIDAALSTLDHVELVDVSPLPRRVRPGVLRSADVALCAPSADTFGSTALEAMACGVPVVATAVGALSDIVLPDVTGLLVPPRDSGRLARSLKTLLADETLREQFGIAARDRVLSRYSRRRLAQETLAAYEHLGLAAHGDRSR